MAGIVVGVDGSPSSRQALEWAAAEAERRHTDLLVVENWHDPMFGGPGFAAMYETDLLYQDTKDAIEAIAAHARDTHPGLSVTTAVVDGSPARSLIDRAVDAQLLVVGARGIGGFLGLELGSVSAKVARRAPVPVVVVRGAHDRTRGREVVVGVDGSECSRRALRWGADWAKAHDKELVALMAWNYLEPQGAHGPTRFRSNYHARDAAEALASIIAEVLGEAKNPRIHTEVVCDLPARAVLERAGDACLVVLGRHGVARWSLPELGATAMQVLHHAECPVAIIPEPEPEPEPAATTDG